MPFTPEMPTQPTHELRDPTMFMGALGNAYVKKGLSPPLHLKECAERWLAEGIPPRFCVEQTRLFLDMLVRPIRSGSGERTLPFLDQFLCRRWLKLQYPDPANGHETSEGESRQSSMIEEMGEEVYRDEVEYWVPKPLRREPVQSQLERAIAFLRGELANGEISVNELNRRAKAAGIKERTLDRARKKLGVRSRRTGFGRTAQHWVSLPEPRKPD